MKIILNETLVVQNLYSESLKKMSEHVEEKIKFA